MIWSEIIYIYIYLFIYLFICIRQYKDSSKKVSLMEEIAFFFLIQPAGWLANVLASPIFSFLFDSIFVIVYEWFDGHFHHGQMHEF